MNSQKEREGDDLVKRAEAARKTGLFKWSVSHGKAADNYEAAAKAYAYARCVSKARRAWRAAAEEHVKSRSTALAARCLEQLGSFAVTFARDLNTAGTTHSTSKPAFTRTEENSPKVIQCMNDGVQAYRDSAELYTSLGDGVREGDMLLRATEGARESALLVATLSGTCKDDSNSGSKPSVACGQSKSRDSMKVYVQLAWKTIDVIERNIDNGESGRHKLTDLYRQLLLFHIRFGDIVEAVQLLKHTLGYSMAKRAARQKKSAGMYDKERNHYHLLKQPENAAKAGLEIIILCLSYHGDVCWARLEFDSMREARVYGFAGSAEERLAEALITAYAERDEQQIRGALAGSHCVNFILPDVARIAKKLTMTGVATAGSDNSCPSANAPVGVSDPSRSRSVASSSATGKDAQNSVRDPSLGIGLVEEEGVHTKDKTWILGHPSEPEIDPEEDLR